ncbi:plantaricin C family lantibiotic [Rothia dentocariosa]|jgi:hypothetical protein|uniref:plantaricin C family lantibiotic n=1 Tax=Rothia dentocariosa TaxID=2047 RepID=UPI000C7DB04D|nr:plantaricin C family lantibiotic [Rothia dentocariosa]PLA18153.1 hypothetical protein CYK04_09765 [Rothia dentocariosa]
MSDITLLEEISEQDLHQANGGSLFASPADPAGVILSAGYTAYSWLKGNEGIACTATKECNCN